MNRKRKKNPFSIQDTSYTPRTYLSKGTLSSLVLCAQGQFKDGFPHGNGLLKWSDGSWYRGEFQRGMRHGRGLHVSGEDGRRWYTGQWADGKRNGFGQTACCRDENVSDGALDYEGHWLDGRPHGRGNGSWPDGLRYTGHWMDGRPHGRGMAVWPDNDVSRFRV